MVVFLPQEFPWNVPPPLRCWQSLILCPFQSQRAAEDGSILCAPAWSDRRDILIFLSARRRWKTLRSTRICNSRAIALQKRTSTSSRRRPGVAGAISRDTGLGIFLCYAPQGTPQDWSNTLAGTHHWFCSGSGTTERRFQETPIVKPCGVAGC